MSATVKNSYVRMTIVWCATETLAQPEGSSALETTRRAYQ